MEGSRVDEETRSERLREQQRRKSCIPLYKGRFDDERAMPGFLYLVTRPLDLEESEQNPNPTIDEFGLDTKAKMERDTKLEYLEGRI